MRRCAQDGFITGDGDALADDVDKLAHGQVLRGVWGGNRKETRLHVCMHVCMHNHARLHARLHAETGDVTRPMAGCAHLAARES